MQALQFSRLGVVEMVEIPEPQVCAGEVIVEVDAAGVCGSDVHGIHGGFLRVPPLVMGHEFTGTVNGRRYGVNPLLSCGSCQWCQQGNEQLCPDRKLIGIHIPGGFTKRIAVPERALVEVPEGISPEAAALIEPLSVSLRGWRWGAARETDKVAVIGAGSIGLGVLHAAVNDGRNVTVCDISEHRLGIAESMGATRTVTELDETFDVIIDAVGAKATHISSVTKLSPQGLAVWIGNISADPGFDARELVRGEQNIRGSFACSRKDFEDAAQLAATIDTSWVQTLPLDQAPLAFAEISEGRSSAIKIQFRP
ncbi:MAG: alcohol dehydrogenase catalytic domain-containing protein [Propionibacteriaceae bacterium]|nr:alcohol dehydrogenase catalytic domain-containing protein [Propionibacteriaceae bacterium]